MFQLIFGIETLAGVVGVCGQIFWVAVTVAKLLKHRNIYQLGRGKKCLRVRDVNPNCKNGDRVVISHFSMMAMLEKKRDLESVRNVHDYLLENDLHVKILDYDEGCTYLIICDEKDPDGKLFFDWIDEQLAEISQPPEPTEPLEPIEEEKENIQSPEPTEPIQSIQSPEPPEIQIVTPKYEPTAPCACVSETLTSYSNSYVLLRTRHYATAATTTAFPAVSTCPIQLSRRKCRIVSMDCKDGCVPSK